jgi:HSP20 family protein
MADITRRDNGNGNLRQVQRDPMTIARDLFAWDPFSEFRRTPSAFAPRFEVKERPEAFVFTADLPGVEEKDLDISLQNGVLTIAGQRAATQKQEGETFYIYERKYGSFSRSFALPELADGDKVEAKLANGVLTVTIAKKQEARPKKITLSKT